MAAVEVALRPDEFARLKAESARLRVEFLRSGLDISYTIARFSEARPGSHNLVEQCRNVAWLGYKRLERMLPQAGPLQEEFAEKLSRLRAALESEEAAEPAETRIPGNGSPDEHHLPRDPRASAHILTRREREVLRHIAEGHSTKEVAAFLGITFKTAACHRYRVMDKLGIHETANLVRYAIRQGVVQA